jgi:hypothetical protein
VQVLARLRAQVRVLAQLPVGELAQEQVLELAQVLELPRQLKYQK